MSAAFTAFQPQLVLAPFAPAPAIDGVVGVIVIEHKISLVFKCVPNTAVSFASMSGIVICAISEPQYA